MRPGVEQTASRARMGAALARLAVARERSAAPLRRALRATVAGRASPDEREWIARIEARRRRLSAEPASAGPPFDPAAPAGGAPNGAPAGVAAELVSLSPPWCRLLMALVRELRPRACLELGTGFGISTAYLAAALRLNGTGTLTTIEGSVPWARRAEQGLAELGLGEVGVRVGPIAELLAADTGDAGPLDFVFIDAEHQAEPTVSYFERLLPRLAPGAVVACDDVHWPEMRRAHARIAGCERAAGSIAIGRLGLTAIAR